MYNPLSNTKSTKLFCSLILYFMGFIRTVDNLSDVAFQFGWGKSNVIHSLLNRGADNLCMAGNDLFFIISSDFYLKC